MKSFIWCGETATGTHSASFMVQCDSGENALHNSSSNLYVKSGFPDLTYKMLSLYLSLQSSDENKNWRTSF